MVKFPLVVLKLVVNLIKNLILACLLVLEINYKMQPPGVNVI